jgi:Predicted carboxypeptidase
MGMSGNDVMELQALFRKMGYEIGAVDGVFGPRTRDAVIAFQRRFGLSADGVVGSATWRALEPFLRGYDFYVIRPGDTFFSIAQRFGVRTETVVMANPDQDPNNLTIGQRIVVPFEMDIVDTNINYTYDVLGRDIQGLKARYPFLETGSIGNSVLGRNLFYLRLGTGPNQVFYNAAHHALEWITSPVLMKFAEDFLRAYAAGQTLPGGYNPGDIWNASSIYIVPMVNPDGVDLVLNGLSPDNPYYTDLIRWNKGSTDFSRDWEANNRGVDLNHNYNAAWEQSKAAEAEYGVTGPGPTRYSGPSPVSEPETQAMVAFTDSHSFRLVMAYHSQGEVIYWNFMDMAPPEGRTIGERLSEISGYRLDQTTGIASYAGYKDWFIQETRRPGYTIEVGMGQNPLPISQFDQIYRDNIGMLLYAATA